MTNYTVIGYVAEDFEPRALVVIPQEVLAAGGMYFRVPDRPELQIHTVLAWNTDHAIALWAQEVDV